MVKKKIIIVFLSLVIASIIFIVIFNNIQKSNQDNFVEKKSEDLNPISKESAKKILEAEFGKDIIISEKDFKDDGDYYIIDVNINIESLEGHNHSEQPNENTEGHIINFGTYKINKYTGELIQK